MNSSMTGSSGLTIAGPGNSGSALREHLHRHDHAQQRHAESRQSTRLWPAAPARSALNGGTLQGTVALTLDNPYTLGTSNVTIAGTNNVTFTDTGTVTNLAATTSAA